MADETTKAPIITSLSLAPPIITLEQGWAVLDQALRPRAALCVTESPPTRQQLAFTMDEYTALYNTVYAMRFPARVDDGPIIKDLCKRYSDHLRDVSERAVALLAGKQGIRLAVALFGVWKSFMMYAERTRGVFRPIDQYFALGHGSDSKYTARRLTALLRHESGARCLEDVAYLEFGEALSGAAAALSGSSADRDIALLQAGVRCMKNIGSSKSQVLDMKWQACVAARDAAARELARRELALMLALCAKDPPRAELGDDSGRLSVAVRLAKKGKNDIVEMIINKPELMIINKFGELGEGARELDRAVTELLA